MRDDDFELYGDEIPKYNNTTFVYPDGCTFNNAAVVCPKERRYDGICDTCGWNPRVARQRALKIRKEMREKADAESD